MIFIVGGAFQGKLDYALKTFPINPCDVGDGKVLSAENIKKYKVINNFHLVISNIYLVGGNIDEFIDQIFALGITELIIADEVGLGVTPISEEERALREIMGAGLIKIAEKSQKIIKVTCGLPQTIK